MTALRSVPRLTLAKRMSHKSNRRVTTGDDIILQPAPDLVLINAVTRWLAVLAGQGQAG